MAGPAPGGLVVEAMPWVALVASLVMLVGACIGISTVRDLLLDSLRAEARVIAQGMAGQVQQVLRSADNALSLLQSDLPLHGPLPDDAALRRMIGCCQMLPGEVGVFLRDRQGTVIASTFKNPELEGALGALSVPSPTVPPALASPGTPSRLITLPQDRPPRFLALLRPPSGAGQYEVGMILQATTLLESFDGLLALQPSAVRLQQQGPIQTVLAQRGSPDLLSRITGTRDTPATGLASWSGQDWLTATSPVPPFTAHVTVSLSAAETMRRWREISLACLAALVALAVAMTGITLALRRHGRARAATVHRLMEAEQDLRLAHAVAQIGEFSLDLATRRVTWSEGVHRLFRTDPRQPMRPLSWILDHLDPEGHKDVRHVWRRLLAEPERNLRSERRIRRADGTTAWCWIEFRLQRDAQGRPAAIRGVLQDITREREAEEQVRRLAEKDSLTGLANRWRLQKHLEESLGAARETGQRVGVLYLDLDGFKSINDRWGHRAGDQLLLQVAERIQAAARPGDLVARLGGDEFVVVQSGLPEDAARAAETIQRLATRLITLLRRSYDLGDGREGIVSASAGLALFPTDAADASGLLECADTALYRTKLAGRNGWSSFSFEMDREIRDARSLEQDLRQAVPQGQLELAWQPQAALDPPRAAPGETLGEASGATVDAEALPRIVGFEALLRWRHPERGLLSPDVFIPSAERSGTILEIGGRRPPRAAQFRPAAGAAGAGGHRRPAAARCRAGAGHAERAARHGGGDHPGRFRHRLFLADDAARLPLRPAEAGPRLHRHHGRGRDLRRHRARHAGPGPQPRPARHRRGGGDGGAGPRPARRGLRGDPGLADRPPPAHRTLALADRGRRRRPGWQPRRRGRYGAELTAARPRRSLRATCPPIRKPRPGNAPPPPSPTMPPPTVAPGTGLRSG
ncbi:MAG: diguanylate cyclase [Roseomonas mucosa]|nr:diguanylate cyclase [Roseomonas mucosa]